MANKRCYFTLGGGRADDTTYTSGSWVLAVVHLNPLNGAPLAIRDLRVHFKGKVHTQISYRSEGRQDINKSKVYLFYITTNLALGDFTVTAHQSWNVALQFPWTGLPGHPSQGSFMSDPFYPQQAEHRLPPTWWIEVGNDLQRINYYFEAEYTLQSNGRTEKHKLPLQFMPPLDLLDPPLLVQEGKPEKLERISRSLNGARGSSSLRKRVFSSEKEPRALFHISATVPSVCAIGENIPVTLHLTYDESASTASAQPVVRLSFLHARVSSNVRYRVIPNIKFTKNTFRTQDSEVKKDVLKKMVVPLEPVYDGMNLSEKYPIQVGWNIGPSFATFTVRRWFVLKITATLECAGKQCVIQLARHDLLVHPSRDLYRAVPQEVLNKGQARMLPNPNQSPTSEAL